MDSAYLKQYVGKALALGLSDVCEKKPADPIDYLSKWLRKHVENLEDEAKEEALSEQLIKDRKLAEEERRRQEAMLEEQDQIAKEIMKRDVENLDDESEKVKETPIPTEISDTLGGDVEGRNDGISPMQGAENEDRARNRITESILEEQNEDGVKENDKGVASAIEIEQKVNSPSDSPVPNEDVLEGTVSNIDEPVSPNGSTQKDDLLSQTDKLQKTENFGNETEELTNTENINENKDLTEESLEKTKSPNPVKSPAEDIKLEQEQTSTDINDVVTDSLDVDV